ncbi:protein catecholamines up-like [Teleopsis dalmanni]|uniref:protein catecholamines up-like n=1 Tax=Teleopsis dalmanni TaxID=139649 RepID=UPI0018CCAED3|nr:protein catecholamines up-like [Teleopsis dalmanni]
MKLLSIGGLAFVLVGLASAGHHHGGGGDGGHGGSVSYSVVTKHDDSHGHGGHGGHGGHDGHHEHSSYVITSHGGGHDGGHGGYDFGHGGHDGGHDGGHHGGHEAHHYPKYEFSYGVEDKHHGDKKSQWEHRDGGHVKGSYSLKEADGTTRVVEYTADKHSGFNAKVHKIGHAHGGHDGGHDHGHGHGHGHGGHGSSYVNVKQHH